MSHRIRHSLEEETKISFVQDLTTALFDTITDSIQCLNFAKKNDSIHYLIKILLVQKSIKTITNFKINCGD